uniref:NAD-dependent protein deacylase sirtuin-5, mitochondrial-like n=1 Tax=Sinocyclocheilus rhinocerous TaxID=307959 RepID=A0A673I1K9_9TELE
MIVRQLTCRRLTSQLCAAVRLNWSAPKMARPSSNLTEFREHFAKAKHIAIITGAGVSAESGVPTFRVQGVHAFLSFRLFVFLDLATPEAFSRDPSLVWEFYHYRREVMRSKMPNPAHLAIAECESRLSKQGRSVVIITQNIDELHHSAGSKHVYEIHGETTRNNLNSNTFSSTVGNVSFVLCVYRCDRSGCNGLLRPHVVWFGETLDSDILTAVEQELEICDLCLVVGTSSVVYPAAMFAPQVAGRGVPVAEFNMECTPATKRFKYHFEGPCGVTLPPALERHESEAI